MEHLAEDNEVYAFDLSSHGGTFDVFSFENFNRDLLTVLQNAKERGAKNVSIVTYSMGGLVTANALLENIKKDKPFDIPKINEMVCFGTPESMNMIPDLTNAAQTVERHLKKGIPIPLIRLGSNVYFAIRSPISIASKATEFLKGVSSPHKVRLGKLIVRDPLKFLREIRENSPHFPTIVNKLQKSGNLPKTLVIFGTKDNVIGTDREAYRDSYKKKLENAGVDVRAMPFAHSPPYVKKIPGTRTIYDLARIIKTAINPKLGNA